MKKNLTLLLSLLFILMSATFGQTNINVMKKEAFSNNLPPVIGKDLVRPDGREATRWFKKSTNELPYADLAVGAKIKVKLRHYIPRKDDTTLTNSYRHGWRLYVVDKQKKEYQLALGYVQLGDSNYVEADISLAIGLFQQDSVGIKYWMGTWAQNPVFVSMDVEVVKDVNIKQTYWLEKIGDGAGVWNEQKDGRWENPKLIVPDDSKNRVIYYLGAGTGEHGTKEVDVKFSVDQKEIYTFSPYVDNCEKYFKYNNFVKAKDTAAYKAGRTGSCIGGVAEPQIIQGSVFNNSLTPGFHAVRLEPQLWQVDLNTSWADYTYAALIYGEANTGFSPASKFLALSTGTTEFVAHDRSVPIYLYLVNQNNGPISGAKAKIKLSGDGLLFSIDNKVWANPLEFDQSGASRIVYAKGTKEGTYKMSIEDMNGALAKSELTLKVYQNLARTIKKYSADGACNWNNEAPQHSIDGLLNTKWCNNDGVEPHWVKYAFDTPTALNYFILHHAEAGGEGAGMNTSDYEIRVFNSDKKAWENFVTVRDNGNGTTYHVKDKLFSSVKCDSVMLYVTKSEFGGGNVARVYEIEMFNAANPLVGNEYEVENGVPVKYEVYQNYPNPFNPSTTIKFFTPVDSQVDIRIYNILGQEVTNLLSGDLNAGTHTIVWDGRNSQGTKVAGGVYFYTVKFQNQFGENQIISKKMVFMP